MGVNRALEEAIKIWVALGGVILVFAWPYIRKEKIRDGLLIALVVIAGANYARYDMSRFSRIDTYDVIHYYLNARYFEELGYFDLYPAMILADQDNEPFSRRLNRFRFQDREQGYRRRPLSAGEERGRVVREEQFTPERWAAFERDFLFLQRQTGFSRRMWRTVLDDRGFNGTPAWVLMAMPWAKLVPAQHIQLLCFLDLIWIFFALFLVRRAYGTNTMLWCLFFLFVTYSWRWTVPGRVFLRHDWMASLMIATSLIKLGRPLLAGLITGYATMMRIFPAVWLYGVAGKAAARILKRRKFEFSRYRRPLTLALGWIIAVVVIEGAAAIVIGTDAIRDHAESISEHITPAELSSRRVGFAIGYGFDWALTPRHITEARKREIEDARTERLVISFLVMLALGWGLRRSRDDEAYGYGFIPFFLLATASYYYFTTRITLIVLHAADLSKLRNRVGLGLLLLIEVFTNGVQSLFPGHRTFLVGGLSQMLTLYCLVMVGWMVFEAHKADAKGDDDDDDDDNESPNAKSPSESVESAVAEDGEADSDDSGHAVHDEVASKPAQGQSSRKGRHKGSRRRGAKRK